MVESRLRDADRAAFPEVCGHLGAAHRSVVSEQLWGMDAARLGAAVCCEQPGGHPELDVTGVRVWLSSENRSNMAPTRA